MAPSTSSDEPPDSARPTPSPVFEARPFGPSWGVRVGDRVRLHLQDGRALAGVVIAISDTEIELAARPRRVIRCAEVTSYDVLPATGTSAGGSPGCCTSFCSPGWSQAPSRKTAWFDAGFGRGGTGRDTGQLAGAAFSYGLDTHSFVRVRWTSYRAAAPGRRTPANASDGGAFLYGVRFQARSAVVFAAAGLGMSHGLTPGRRLYTDGRDSWYRPIHYTAVSGVADAYAGFVSHAVGIGVGVLADGTRRRQIVGWQLMITYGALDSRGQVR